MNENRYQISDEPSFSERFAFLNIFKDILINSSKHPKSTRQLFTMGSDNTIIRIFKGKNNLKKKTFERIVTEIETVCTWVGIEDDIKNLRNLFELYEMAIPRDGHKVSTQRKLSQIQSRINRAPKIDFIINEEISFKDFSYNNPEDIANLIDRYIVEQRISGGNESAADRAIIIASGLKIKLESLNKSSSYISSAVSSALDAGSYAAFQALDVMRLHQIRKHYADIGSKEPIFLIHQHQNLHQIASASERVATGWKTEDDVYKKDVRSASTSLHLALEKREDDYVKLHNWKLAAWMGNSAVELALSNFPLDAPLEELGNSSIEGVFLQSIQDCVKDNLEAAGRFCCSLGREYLRRAQYSTDYVEKAEDMADRAHGYLLSLIPAEKQPLMQKYYAFDIIQHHNPTAWAGWLVLMARIELQLIEWSADAKGIPILNFLTDATRLYTNVGARSLAAKSRLTAERFARHLGLANQF